MASIMFAQNLLSTARKRKAQDSIEYLRRRDGGSKARTILLEEEIQFKICSLLIYKRAKRKRSRGAERLSMVAAWIPLVDKRTV